MEIRVETDGLYAPFVASAADFDPESPMGAGDTAEDAILDLYERIEDQEGR